MLEKSDGRHLLTTGELAQACDVTVRTVQYYDQRGLLKPTERSEGGRRLYDDAALERMHTICVLKGLGLPLKAIRGVLEGDESPEVLRCLLQEQEKDLVAKARSTNETLAAVRAELARLGSADQEASSAAETTREDEPNMEPAMSKVFADKGTRLYQTQRKILLEGIVIDLVEVACIAYGVTTGNWAPLLVALPLFAIIVAELVRMYHRDARYVCPHCHATFQPAMREFFFSSHTPKTRKLTCTSCCTKHWCVEVPASDRT